jgi:hypothetical protein
MTFFKVIEQEIYCFNMQMFAAEHWPYLNCHNLGKGCLYVGVQQYVAIKNVEYG